MAKQGFVGDDLPQKIRGYHGAARFQRVKPDVAQQGVKSLNIDMTLSEALKLRLALDSCLHSINRYNRSTSKGKAMGVMLSIKTKASSIAIIETTMRQAPKDEEPLEAEG